MIDRSVTSTADTTADIDRRTDADRERGVGAAGTGEGPIGGSGGSPMTIRPMVRDELDVLIGWADGEGWKPGLGDAEVYWATDPGGFVAAEIDGELIGGGSIVAYGRSYGFMGLFIVRPDRRHAGLGRELWHTRKRLLLDRLDDGAAIEMDGVFDMVSFYEKGGFVLQHRDLRYRGIGAPDAVTADVAVVDVATIPFAAVEAYDAAHFAAPRPAFLRRWVDRPGGHAVAVHDGTACRGLAVSRPCRDGHRIGPLFADDEVVADALLSTISARLAGEELFLDVPERNPAAMALVERRAMTEVFGCARMTFGPPPALPWHEIYGVTTFELG
jgi:ribosomal protein S18 acetylase RimI-like enzyme